MKFEEVFKNKTIFITGGTGFLGRALIKALLKFDPSCIRVYSRDEVKHHNIEVLFSKNSKIESYIGDVRDTSRLERALKGSDIVIHAAALKRLDMLEYNVSESIKTNILGTLNVIDACIKYDVEKAVYVSTDKASEPVNTYGACKFIGERLFTESSYHKKNLEKTIFTSVRYGNVLESTDSVIPFFESKLKNGEKIPVTDTRMTRFIISPKQAVELIFTALSLATGGEIFVPILPAFKLMDLIEILKEKWNKECEIEIVGVRPGEKIHEVMVNKSEVLRTYRYENLFIITSAIENSNNNIIPIYVVNGKKLEESEFGEFNSNDAVVSKEEVIKLFKKFGIMI